VKRWPLLDKHNLMVSPIYLEFFEGRNANSSARPWGNSGRFKPARLEGPLATSITDNHYKSLPRDGRYDAMGKNMDRAMILVAPICMMHVGFETTSRAWGETPVGRYLENAEVAVFRAAWVGHPQQCGQWWTH